MLEGTLETPSSVSSNNKFVRVWPGQPRQLLQLGRYRRPLVTFCIFVAYRHPFGCSMGDIGTQCYCYLFLQQLPTEPVVDVGVQ